MDSHSNSGSSHSGAHRPRSGGYLGSKGPRSGASRSSTPRHAGGYKSRPNGGRGSVRPSYGSGRSAPKRGMHGVYIDPARLVAKATVTEEIVEYVPTHHFKDFLVQEALKRNIIAKGYATPTPIQDKSIPHGLEGKDIIGIANTGTGKTAAFLIPLINKVMLNPKERVLVMVPTRELAVQIEDEFRGFAKGLHMSAVILIGGANINPQLGALKRRPSPAFVIGTPGRIKDVIERRALDLSGFNTLVLDEADRMLDMGFIREMEYLVGLMPKVRQTMFFSATFTKEIEALTHAFLKDPVKISVKVQDTSANVDQDIVRVADKSKKMDTLHNMLIQPGFKKVLIFGRTKHGVENLSKMLRVLGFKAEAIHGNKTHANRQRALQSFKGNHVQILVATDVAARGLDIPDVTHVINFDMPATYEDYVHRIGRTGRAGRKGNAITFVD